MKGVAGGSAVLLLLAGMVAPSAFGDPRSTDPGVRPNTLEFLSYEDTGYKFEIIPPGESPPTDFEEPGFDDSAFNKGDGAFGSGGSCPLQETVATDWPTDSELLIRRGVQIPDGATNVRIMVSVDNDFVEGFFNGVSIAQDITHEDCPIRDEFRLDVPQELIKPGPNLLAFHLRDRGGQSFFDARVLAELPNDLERVAIPLKGRPLVPIVPVTTPTLGCDSSGTSRGLTVRFNVEATGDAGEIRFDQPIQEQPGSEFTAVRLFINDQLVLTTLDRAPGPRQLASLSPLLESSPTTLFAFGTVLTREDVSQAIGRCLAAAIVQRPGLTRSECEAVCRNLARAYRWSCKLLMAGGGILSGGTSGLIVSTFGGDLCDEAISGAEQECLDSCKTLPNQRPSGQHHSGRKQGPDSTINASLPGAACVDGARRGLMLVLGRFQPGRQQTSA
jgi:hypothetical protein